MTVVKEKCFFCVALGSTPNEPSVTLFQGTPVCADHAIVIYEARCDWKYICNGVDALEEA